MQSVAPIQPAPVLNNTQETPEIVVGEKQKGSSKKIVIIILIVAVLLVIIGVVAFFLIRSATNTQGSTGEQTDTQADYVSALLESVVAEVNKTAPMLIDELTRLDGAEVVQGNTLQYNYSLISHNVATTDVQALKSSTESRIINAVKTNTTLKLLRDNNVTFKYHYNDVKGLFMFEVTVTPDLYSD